MGYDEPEKVISSEDAELEPMVKDVLCVYGRDLIGLGRSNVHVFIGSIFLRDSRICEIAPSHHPTEIERTGDLHLLISQQARPCATIAVRVVRHAGAPLFRPWAGRPEVVGELRARRADTQHNQTNPQPPSPITCMSPRLSRLHVSPWEKDPLAGLVCIRRVVIVRGICPCAALHGQ